MRDMKNDLFLLDLMDLMPEKKNAGREKFQSVSIGGLGDIRLKAIRFDEYSLEFQNGAYWLLPVFTPKIMDRYERDVEISGVDMLISLSELYDDINRPGRSEKPALELISEWCISHIHPYAQKGIISEIDLEKMLSDPEDDPLETTPGDPMEQLLAKAGPMNTGESANRAHANRVEYHAAFPADDFLEDLHRLISAFHIYLAITDLRNNKPEAARTLYYAGKRYDAPTLFEHFKTNGEPIWTDDAVMYGFADMFPPLMMEMAYDYNADCMKLEPVVCSIFDACWYTLSCATGLADQVQSSARRFRFVRCAACGKLITAYGQQRYCKSEECQKQRARAKSQASYERKRKNALPNVLPNDQT